MPSVTDPPPPAQAVERGQRHYAAFEVQYFDSQNPLEDAAKVRHALKVMFNKRMLEDDIEVEIVEHSGVCSLEFCGRENRGSHCEVIE